MKLPQSLTLRAAHASEAPAIARLSRLHVEYGLQWRWTPRRVRHAIQDRETMVLVASRDGELTGFAIMKFRDEEAHLLLLAVLPEARRIGIGASLVRWLEKSCDTAGMRQIRLEVRSGNAGARQFYRALGYRFVGQIGAYYDRRESATVMIRTLRE